MKFGQYLTIPSFIKLCFALISATRMQPKTHKKSRKPLKIKSFRREYIIPTRCRDLHLKQFCLEDIMPAILIVLITHIILAVRWMLIKILSVVINHHGRGNTVVSGGCHPNNNIIRKIDQKSKMGLSHFVTLILYSVYRHARYCGYYN